MQDDQSRMSLRLCIGPVTMEYLPESYCVTTNVLMSADDHEIYHAGRDQSSVTSKLRTVRALLPSDMTSRWKPQEI